ncbi:nuclear transport factor 2 family protein [Nonomuraea salmonea]|uniref:YybH family protein n=1 Tax=Nonomuraea salmonea TaxID=46181 RepID=UPI002FEB93BF
MIEPRPWIEGYVRAWNSNDPDDIAALFTESAVYYPEPFSRPWQGRDEIISQWLGRQDKPGEADFQWHPVCVTDDVSIIQGVTTYPDKNVQQSMGDPIRTRRAVPGIHRMVDAARPQVMQWAEPSSPEEIR